jgi:hypothetical protein
VQDASGELFRRGVRVQLAAGHFRDERVEGLLRRSLADAFEQDLPGDAKYLVTRIVLAVLRECAGRIEERAMLGDRVDELLEASAFVAVVFRMGGRREPAGARASSARS